MRKLYNTYWFGNTTEYMKFSLTSLGGAMPSALAAMAMSPARTWVRVPPKTSGVFLACNKVSLLPNQTL